MRPAPAVRFEPLKQLGGKYWRPFVSVLAAALAAVNGLKAFGLPVDPLLGALQPPVARYWVIGLGVFFFVLIRFPRVAVAVTRLILGPPKPLTNLPTIFRGPRPYGSTDVLPGRQREIDECWRLIRDAAFCILEGESGCGKSFLLNAALLPPAREVFRVVECRDATADTGRMRN